MYSAFVGGYIMRALLPEEDKEVDKIKDFAMALFVPIYFALVGIQLDVINNFSLVRFLLFFMVAFGLEFVGTVIFMWFTKLKRKTVLSLGITMNARGGPGIVLATTAFAYNIINIEFFTVLILTTMLSSAIAGYWLRMVKEDIQNDGQ
jgi:Kef-type K+ transport system membrane component KefB